MRTVRQYRTAPLACFAARFSPYQPDTLAAASSAHFGLRGAARCDVFHGDSHTAVDLKEACFDVCFAAAGVVAVASADGFVHICSTAHGAAACVRSKGGHVQECSSVDSSGQVIASSGWDGAVLLHSAEGRLLARRAHHAAACHQVTWHPSNPSVLVSAGADHHLVICDLRGGGKRVLRNEHPEVMTVDWCKYNDDVLACGSADGAIRVWDVRQGAVQSTLRGHRRAVRRLVWSPFRPDRVLSASYDMTVVEWDTASGLAVDSDDAFTEFACGVDYSVHERGLKLACSWDGTVRLCS